MLPDICTGGGEADGTEFAGAMAQRVFRTIGTAADDVKAVFGEEATDLAALFLVWALQETERCSCSMPRGPQIFAPTHAFSAACWYDGGRLRAVSQEAPWSSPAAQQFHALRGAMCRRVMVQAA